MRHDWNRALAPLLLFFGVACATTEEGGAPFGDPPPPVAGDDASVGEPAADASGSQPLDGVPCYGEVEFPTAYCGYGTTCAEGRCLPAVPCTDTLCDGEPLLCYGTGCEAPPDESPSSEPPPDEPPPEEPPPSEPPPSEPPAPTAPDTPRLLVRLEWDSAGDMDLHMLNPTATRWSGHDDCNYANCEGGLEWGVASDLDNPSLSRDVTSRLGPERIVIQHPQPGTYRVGVDAYDGRSNVRVHIECGHLPKTRNLGPLNLGASGERFWRVADVEIRSDGSCGISPLREVATRREWDRR